MDTDMADVSKVPDHHLSLSDPGAIPTLDSWIDSLMSCKQLAESDVQRLCDKVGMTMWRQEKECLYALCSFDAEILRKLGKGSAARRVKCSASGMNALRLTSFDI
jgi:hypothetical protein